MEAHEIRLLEFLGSSKRTFNIPVYQRNYNWKKEHCERLFNDVENIAKSNLEINHFIGTVVYVKSKTLPNFMELILIDGQQRITTVMLLIKALHDAIEDKAMKEDIWETYLINKHAPEKYRVKLKPIETDQHSFEKVFEGEHDPTDSNISRNYRLFQEMIASSDNSPEELYYALSNVEIVYISLDKEKRSENPQLIFESINSTGLYLTPADLIRNFLLMNNSYERQTELYKKYWLKIEDLITNSRMSDFIRDYLTAKTRMIPKKDEVYPEFKLFVTGSGNADNTEAVLSDLLIYAGYYAWLVTCNSPHKDINYKLRQFQLLKSTVVYPLLMILLKLWDLEKSVERENLLETLNIMITYIFRREVCGYPTNALNKLVPSIIQEILTANSPDVFETTIQFLLNKSLTLTFPRNEEFCNCFVSKSIYKTKIDKYTLSQIELFKNKEAVDINGDITIEHIMPQKLNDKWQEQLGENYHEIHSQYLHTIGNLALSGYNPELSNMAFEQKKSIYAKSNIELTRAISDFENWTEKAITVRAEGLCEIALQIWDIPAEYNDKKASVSSLDYSTQYSFSDDIDVTGEKPATLTICGKSYFVDSWKGIMKRLYTELYELDSELFASLMKHSDFMGKYKNILSATDTGLRSPLKISEGIYVETNLNAVAILKYCGVLSEHYSFEDEVYFTLASK